MANGSQYATSATVTSTGLAVAFGLNANTVHLTNDGTSDLYVDFTTTGGGVTSTGGYRVKTLESVSITSDRGYYTGMSLVAGSTTVNETARILAIRC